MAGNFIVEDIKRIFKGDNPLSKVILITVITFISVNLIQLGFPEINYWLSLSANPADLLFKPWTLITHMFMHFNLWHILFNMLWLYWMGNLIVEYLGPHRFSAIYFMGGISGALLLLVFYAIVAPGAEGLSMGASAGVMAIVVAAATKLPDFEIGLLFFGRVKLKYVALGIFILSTVLDLSSNTGGKVAHFGGALFGFLYIRALNRGTDWAVPYFGILNPFLNLFKKRKGNPRMKVVKKGGQKSQSKARRKKPEADQKRIDAILEKIHASGYDALSKEEKEILFKASNKK